MQSYLAEARLQIRPIEGKHHSASGNTMLQNGAANLHTPYKMQTNNPPWSLIYPCNKPIFVHACMYIIHYKIAVSQIVRTTK